MLCSLIVFFVTIQFWYCSWKTRTCKQWVWLCSKKAVFTKTSSNQDPLETWTPYQLMSSFSFFFFFLTPKKQNPSKIYWFAQAHVCLVTRSCPTLCDPMDLSLPGSSVHGDSPGKNTGVGCPAFVQGIFPTQGLNPGLPHCRWILCQLNHQESQYKLIWIVNYKVEEDSRFLDPLFRTLCSLHYFL